jgi:hypothetical protein
MLDTRTKRSSVLGLALASFLILPATVDRDALAYSYSGIPAMPTNVLKIQTFTPQISIAMFSVGVANGIDGAGGVNTPPDIIVTVPGRIVSVLTYKPSVVIDVVVRG